ncbi:hypothetical protein PLICRDRAFT_57776 [Plicaturopsis crispa FD-325 SS-3]|uniref:Uncharacterized protein n=1 Tax=Plicaturopsis crispa FD-325 SS-3 TaxID=944288 RepID=A0A0C9T4W5_PLICR|nr:hypothetical protein PLICRDRAFT_57776 [Plicaturopsis crispa FD-325 SS-3]
MQHTDRRLDYSNLVHSGLRAIARRRHRPSSMMYPPPPTFLDVDISTTKRDRRSSLSSFAFRSERRPSTAPSSRDRRSSITSFSARLMNWKAWARSGDTSSRRTSFVAYEDEHTFHFGGLKGSDKSEELERDGDMYSTTQLGDLYGKREVDDDDDSFYAASQPKALEARGDISENLETKYGPAKATTYDTHDSTTFYPSFLNVPSSSTLQSIDPLASSSLSDLGSSYAHLPESPTTLKPDAQEDPYESFLSFSNSSPETSTSPLPSRSASASAAVSPMPSRRSSGVYPNRSDSPNLMPQMEEDGPGSRSSPLEDWRQFYFDLLEYEPSISTDESNR